MTTPDIQALGEVPDRLYATISGPKGPRDWKAQADCFMPEPFSAAPEATSQAAPG
jgi:hypothetical protein